MSTSVEERALELLGELLELPEEERGDRLAAACPQGGPVLERVKELLVHDDETNGARLLALPLEERLQASVGGDDGDAHELEAETNSLRAALTSYTIDGKLGYGGFGDVYVAWQVKPRRRVALKVSRSLASDPDAVERFKRESEFLAGLKHPGIAQVFEAGSVETDRGERHFIVMELVEGARSITAHAEHADLDVREKMRLLRSACEAVGYANALGVIHRDLKPSNLLVGADGVLKIIDFGIARMTGGQLRGGLTAKGSIVGSFEFMSPEQLAGSKPDAKSEVYSLGMVGFELFAGKSPGNVFQRSKGLSLVAGDLDMELHGDVEEILNKALEWDPEKRYATAHEVAEDIRRSLDGLPIGARAPSVRYHLAKLNQRNPWVVRLGMVLLAVLSAGLVFSVVMNRKLSRRNEMLRESSAELLRLNEKELRPRYGTQVVARAWLDVAERTTEALLEGAPDDVELRMMMARITQSKASLVSSERPDIAVLEAALQYLEEVAPKAGDNLEFERLRLLLTVRIGDSLKSAQQFEAALDRYRSVLERERELAVRFHDNEPIKDDLCWSHYRIGHLLRKLGRHDEAAIHARDQHRIAKTLDGEKYDPLLANYVLGYSHIHLAQAALDQGLHQQAAVDAREAVRLGRELSRTSPHDYLYRDFKLAAMKTLGSSLKKAEGTFDEVRRLHAEEMWDCWARAQLQPDAWVTLDAYVNAHGALIGWLARSGYLAEALDEAQRLIGTTNRLGLQIDSNEVRTRLEFRARMLLAPRLSEGAKEQCVRDVHDAFTWLELRGVASQLDSQVYASFLTSVCEDHQGALEVLDKGFPDGVTSDAAIRIRGRAMRGLEGQD